MGDNSDGVSGQKPPVKGRGRPQFQPTDEQRQTVARLRAEGKNAAEIAQAIGIGRNTLRRHFPLPADDGGPLGLSGQHQPERLEPTGRPEYEPSGRQREDVKLCKADDWSDDRIAKQLGISRTTLLKHFAAELEDGADQVRLRNLRNLQRAADGGNVTACRTLIEMGEDAPGMLPVPTPEHESPPALGKKEAAKVAAQTAEQGTSWASLVKH